jgi:hypothetical protein
MAEETQAMHWTNRLSRAAPGLATLWPYDWKNLAYDVIAGLSVGAVALPLGVAYAQLAGFNPAVGLYSSILPLFAYAVFRHVAKVIHRSRRGHLRTGERRGHAIGGRRCDGLRMAIHNAGAVRWGFVHRRKLFEIGSAGGLFVETHPRRVPERRCPQHHSRTNRKNLRLSDCRGWNRGPAAGVRVEDRRNACSTCCRRCGIATRGPGVTLSRNHPSGKLRMQSSMPRIPSWGRFCSTARVSRNCCLPRTNRTRCGCGESRMPVRL